eukprot:TRINITY_DN43610_c0_g1_i1.p1 TRINITY_DN43610_c0_g1~~TRINITY_DN43610_c0_g1_i1.p1  ORF type:complete len:462 (+),score=128.81 TRINITY_DN43610_c0_g1_i1:32-1387(+)
MADAVDAVQETLEVHDRDIGIIIGTRRCNIRALEEGTQCKIVTPPWQAEGTDPGLRQVTITGSKAQVARCKEAISGVLMGEQPKDILAQIDGAIVMKNVDPMSMGHLAKVKAKLEEELDVTLDLDARTIRIWGKDGSQDKAVDAKERIEAELEDMTTVETLHVPVPPNIVNQVINETALRQLQDQTGLTANVYKNDQGTGIRLTGLAGALQEAKAFIEQRSSGQGSEFLSLMPGLFGTMEAKAKADFQRDMGMLSQNCGAKVTIREEANRIDFAGGPEEARHARSEMQNILHFYFPKECETIALPPESVDWIAGDDDRELMRLQASGACVALDRNGASLWICGNQRSVEQVRNRVRNSLDRWNKQNAIIHLERKNSAWAIIGKGGETIRNLQSSTDTKIDVEPELQKVTISGKEEGVRAAKAKIMQIIGGGWGGGWGQGGAGCWGVASGWG